MLAKREDGSAVGAGIVGPNGIGAVHIDAIRRLGVEIAAVAASTPERSAAAAAAHGATRACADARELIEAPEVEVVHICTPNDQHAALAEAALRAGKHVVCEKPLARSSEEAEPLVALAAESDVIAAVTYNYRAYPLVEYLRSAVSDGRLGELHLIRGAYLLEEVFGIEDSSHWMLDPERIGPALALIDVGVHWWDLVEYVSGQRIVEALCTRQAVRPGGGAGEDSAAIMLRLESGAVAMAAISNAAPGHGNTIDFEFIGTAATGAWSQQDPEKLWFAELGEAPRVIWRGEDTAGAAGPSTLQRPIGQPQGYLDAFRDLMARIYGQITGVEPGLPVPDFADGLRGVRVLEALIESTAKGAWIPVDA